MLFAGKVRKAGKGRWEQGPAEESGISRFNYSHPLANDTLKVRNCNQ